MWQGFGKSNDKRKKDVLYCYHELFGDRGEIRMAKLLWIGFGGAFGAVLRYLLSLIPVKGNFPAVTLAVNISGAVLIGAVVCAASRAALTQPLVLFLKVGVCGGFTTFSTFSLETLQLLESGKYLQGLFYALLSVAACVAGVFLGRSILEAILVR